MTEDSRASLLRKIVAYEQPIEPAIEALGNLPYDCDVDLVTIGPADLLSVIDRCVAGELTWELANPTINGEITPERLSTLRAELAGLAR